jgi:hypothetical protein
VPKVRANEPVMTNCLLLGVFLEDKLTELCHVAALNGSGVPVRLLANFTAGHANII